MCRNIKTLANFAPPATHDEIRASALQFVRKLSGSNHPSRANEAAFNRAVDDVSAAAHRLIESLTTSAAGIAFSRTINFRRRSAGGAKLRLIMMNAVLVRPLLYMSGSFAQGRTTSRFSRRESMA